MPHGINMSEELPGTALDELVTAWESDLEMTHAECREFIRRVLCSLLKTLKVDEDFYLPIDNQYFMIVRKLSEKELALQKAEVVSGLSKESKES